MNDPTSVVDITLSQLAVRSERKKLGMASKLDSVTKQFDQFLLNVEKDAEGLGNKLEGLEVKRTAVFTKAHAKADARAEKLKQVDDYLDKLDVLSNSDKTTDPT